MPGPLRDKMSRSPTSPSFGIRASRSRPPPASSAWNQQEQTAASKLRMEKRGEKLEKAKEKLVKQKPPKPSGPVRRVAGTVGGGVHGYVHGKLFEVEQENVGTEGAHRSELVGESALRHGKRFVQKKIREHPAKAVRKAESRHIKARLDYHYRMAAQEHPEMRATPCPGCSKSRRSSGNMPNKHGRPPSKGPRPLKKRQSPRRSWRPGPWASSSGIPWGRCCL